MLTERISVENELGIHARVACRIVRCVNKHQSKVVAKKNGMEFDFGSVSGVITIDAKCGDVLTIQIDGSDEQETARELKELFACKFGEK